MAKRQVTIGLDAALLEAVDLYRNQLPIPASRSKAIEALVRHGLRAADPQLTLGLGDGSTFEGRPKGMGIGEP